MGWPCWVKEQEDPWGSRVLIWCFSSTKEAKERHQAKSNYRSTCDDSKIPNKTLQLHLGKLQGKTEQSFCLSIILASRREKEMVSFPFLSPGRWEISIHGTDSPGQFSCISVPLQTFRGTEYFLFTSHCFSNEHALLCNHKGKNNLHFKNLAGHSCFQYGNLKTHTSSPL